MKKSLGQHFLNDENILQKIAAAIGDLAPYATVLEIGPGQGALTKYLLQEKHDNFFVVELDDRWAAHLEKTYPALRGKIIHADFLEIALDFLRDPTHIVGNFPYNISSQIVFRVIDHRNAVEQVTGMFQKEVAVRIASGHGSKDYGVISVLTQAYYDCKYLFDVAPECFNPPPKVTSGVIQLRRRKREKMECDEQLFKRVVKAAFNQRRKTMRNSLKQLAMGGDVLTHEVFDLRPEQISVSDFEKITMMIEMAINK